MLTDPPSFEDDAITHEKGFSNTSASRWHRRPRESTSTAPTKTLRFKLQTQHSTPVFTSSNSRSPIHAERDPSALSRATNPKQDLPAGARRRRFSASTESRSHPRQARLGRRYSGPEGQGSRVPLRVRVLNRNRTRKDRSVRGHHLPVLPEDDEESEGHSPSRRRRRASKVESNDEDNSLSGEEEEEDDALDPSDVNSEIHDSDSESQDSDVVRFEEEDEDEETPETRTPTSIASGANILTPASPASPAFPTRRGPSHRNALLMLQMRRHFQSTPHLLSRERPRQSLLLTPTQSQQQQQQHHQLHRSRDPFEQHQQQQQDRQPSTPSRRFELLRGHSHSRHLYRRGEREREWDEEEVRDEERISYEMEESDHHHPLSPSRSRSRSLPRDTPPPRTRTRSRRRPEEEEIVLVETNPDPNLSGVHPPHPSESSFSPTTTTTTTTTTVDPEEEYHHRRRLPPEKWSPPCRFDSVGRETLFSPSSPLLKSFLSSNSTASEHDRQHYGNAHHHLHHHGSTWECSSDHGSNVAVLASPDHPQAPVLPIPNDHHHDHDQDSIESDVADAGIVQRRGRGMGRCCLLFSCVSPLVKKWCLACWRIHQKQLTFMFLGLIFVSWIGAIVACSTVPFLVADREDYFLVSIGTLAASCVVYGGTFLSAVLIPILFDLWVIVWSLHTVICFNAVFYITHEIQVLVMPLIAVPSAVHLFAGRCSTLGTKTIVSLVALLPTLVGAILYGALFRSTAPSSSSSTPASKVLSIVLSMLILFFVFLTNLAALFHDLRLGAQFKLFEKIAIALEDLNFHPLLRFVKKWKRYYGQRVLREVESILSQLHVYKSFIPPSLHSEFVMRLNEHEVEKTLSRKSCSKFASFYLASEEVVHVTRDYRFETSPSMNADPMELWSGPLVGCGLEVKDISLMWVVIDDCHDVIDTIGEQEFGRLMEKFIEALQHCVEDHKGVLHDVQHGGFVASWNAVTICREHETSATIAGLHLLRLRTLERWPLAHLLRISIITDDVRCGHCGSPYFRRFVFCDTDLRRLECLSRVSRLHIPAPCLTISETTRECIKRRFHCLQFDAILDRKRRHEEIHRVFVVLGPVDRSLSPFISSDSVSSSTDSYLGDSPYASGIEGSGILVNPPEAVNSRRVEVLNRAWKLYLNGAFSECVAELIALNSIDRDVKRLLRRARARRVFVVDMDCLHYSVVQ